MNMLAIDDGADSTCERVAGAWAAYLLAQALLFTLSYEGPVLQAGAGGTDGHRRSLCYRLVKECFAFPVPSR